MSVRWLAVCLLLTVAIVAQAGVIEDWIESAGNPEELAFQLQIMREQPLELNSANAHELGALPYLRAETITLLVSGRDSRGGFESLDEVLALHFLTPEERLSLREFATVRRLRKVRNYLRTGASLRAADDKTLGAAEMAARVRGSFESTSGASGFVYGRRIAHDSDGLSDVSLGVRLPQQEYRPELLAGDFQMEAGTGLVFASSWGSATWLASPQVVTVPRAQGLVAKPTTDQMARLRGLGAGYTSRGMRIAIAVSRQDLDGAVLDGEADRFAQATAAGDLAEAREHQIEESLIGAMGSYDYRGAQLEMAGFTSHFQPLFRESRYDDALPRLQGDRLHVASISGSYQYQRLSLISEVAVSSPGGSAHQTAVTWRERGVAWTLFHVYAADDFYSPHSKLWGGYGEAAGNTRATGARFFHSGRGYSISATGVTERSPFRTSLSPLRKSEDDVDLRLSIRPREQVELIMLLGRRFNEVTDLTSPATGLRTDRARLESVFAGLAEYKLRLEVRAARRADSSDSKLGSLLYFQVKTALGGVRLFSRLSVWDIEHSDAGFSMHEQALYGDFPLVALSDSGRRIAVMATRQFSSFRIGVKAAHTARYARESSIEFFEAALEFGWRWQ